MGELAGGTLRVGPVADRVAIWPIEDGRYGLDATFQGKTGFERAQMHEAVLTAAGIDYSFRQEFDDGWTLRFGPIGADEVAAALQAFVV